MAVREKIGTIDDFIPIDSPIGATVDPARNNRIFYPAAPVSPLPVFPRPVVLPVIPLPSWVIVPDQVILQVVGERRLKECATAFPPTKG